MKDYVLVMVTAPSQETGAEIARALIERKLSACVNIIPSVTSLYTWSGELCTDEEVLLVIKTTGAAFDELVAGVEAVHPYDVPEIIALPIVAGSRDYLDWIDDAVEDRR